MIVFQDLTTVAPNRSAPPVLRCRRGICSTLRYLAGGRLNCAPSLRWRLTPSDCRRARHLRPASGAVAPEIEPGYETAPDDPDPDVKAVFEELRQHAVIKQSPPGRICLPIALFLLLGR